ncbi:rhodanese-like domain-containing protein [Hymenobacter sediminicola]|uniref:Rhodanese-like domain-containing protein n=1 Tax=Hymenobacter sediminicola TaxID=2761579 RepID=A0A7G7W875_9BACT|nr:rhodanese-like domain-containing protein [Hymenobacter sediminicola]QNH62568.1 rhodanese-like domain-containing protein [Hymenobacter sediminicola]
MLSIFETASHAYQNLTPTQFAAGMRLPGALLIDVRRPDEFAAGHLPSARNIDITHTDFAKRIAALDNTRAVYVYCRSGARSATAAKQLGTVGFEQVFNLAGGLLDWPSQLAR